MFAPVELRRLMQCAGPEFRAMILLALNAGLGNGDLAQLKTSDIQGVWLDYSRPKTGIERRVPLWPETREALAAVIRPDDDLVFVPSTETLGRVRARPAPPAQSGRSSPKCVRASTSTSRAAGSIRCVISARPSGKSRGQGCNRVHPGSRPATRRYVKRLSGTDGPAPLVQGGETHSQVAWHCQA